MNARSKALELPDYMFEPKFSKEKFITVLIDRIGGFCGIGDRKVYIIAITFGGLAKIVTVTQNNEKESVGFPGGRILIDIGKCPEDNGKAHAYLNYITYAENDAIDNNMQSGNRRNQSRSCMLCGLVDPCALSLKTENERRFMWRGLKQWALKYKNEIKQSCAEKDAAAAVRTFRNETGLYHLDEENLLNCESFRLGMCKFYVYRGGATKNINPANHANEIKSVNFRSFDDLLKLSDSGRMSNMHSQAFKYYLENPL